MAAFTVGVVLVVTACGGDDNNVAITATTPPSAEAFDDSSSEIIDDDLVEDTTEQSDVASADTTTSDRTIGDESVPATTNTAEAFADAGVAQRIVSLSPTATEMLYAIGAGAQVLAVDDLSDYPPPATEKMQGLSALEPNIETIAGLEPDLVITDGTNAALLEQLESLGIAHWEGQSQPRSTTSTNRSNSSERSPHDLRRRPQSSRGYRSRSTSSRRAFPSPMNP